MQSLVKSQNELLKATMIAEIHSVEEDFMLKDGSYDLTIITGEFFDKGELFYKPIQIILEEFKRNQNILNRDQQLTVDIILQTRELTLEFRKLIGFGNTNIKTATENQYRELYSTIHKNDPVEILEKKIVAAKNLGTSSKFISKYLGITVNRVDKIYYKYKQRMNTEKVINGKVAG